MKEVQLTYVVLDRLFDWCEDRKILTKNLVEFNSVLYPYVNLQVFRRMTSFPVGNRAGLVRFNWMQIPASDLSLGLRAKQDLSLFVRSYETKDEMVLDRNKNGSKLIGLPSGEREALKTAIQFEALAS